MIKFSLNQKFENFTKFNSILGTDFATEQESISDQFQIDMELETDSSMCQKKYSQSKSNMYSATKCNSSLIFNTNFCTNHFVTILFFKKDMHLLWFLIWIILRHTFFRLNLCFKKQHHSNFAPHILKHISDGLAMLLRWINISYQNSISDIGLFLQCFLFPLIFQWKFNKKCTTIASGTCFSTKFLEEEEGKYEYFRSKIVIFSCI